MEYKDWKIDLKDLFEGVEIIKLSQKEVLEKFNNFRELIAEPAFETLSEELKEYKVKTYYTKSKGRTIHFRMSFPRSGKDSFHYIICLPKNSLELNLKLRIKARRDKRSQLEEREEEFMEYISPSDIEKITKEDLIQDIIKQCRNYKFEILTRTD